MSITDCRKKRSWPSRSHLSLLPSAHLSSTRSSPSSALVSLEPSNCWPAQRHTSSDNCPLACAVNSVKTIPVSSSLKQQPHLRGAGGNLNTDTKRRHCHYSRPFIFVHTYCLQGACDVFFFMFPKINQCNYHTCIIIASKISSQM